MGQALDSLKDTVRAKGSVPVSLELQYSVVFSTLMGNIPINTKLIGEIEGIPVDLRLSHSIIPNCDGAFPVNTRLKGTIGGEIIQARMPFKIVFSTIAGNIPVNTGVEWENNGVKHGLNMSYGMVPAFARGGGGGAALESKTSGMKAKRVFDAKFKGGKMVEANEAADEGRIVSEAGRPVCDRLFGEIGGIEVDLRFRHLYYCNTSSGRNPINVRAEGFLRDSALNNPS